MKKLVRTASILALATLICVPLNVHAQQKPRAKSEVVMKMGNKLHLFHSGTADVKKEIAIGDVIPVYRESMGGSSVKTKEVGKIKVLSYIGEHYFEAEVVEGEIKTGDIAKKETASFLVQPVKSR